MKRALRLATAFVVASGFLLVGSASEAASPIPLECHAGGSLTTTGLEPATWSFFASGRCADGTPAGSLTIEVVGGGQSDNLGLCSGDLTLDNLNLSATVTLTQFGLIPKTTITTQHWVASVSTYPIVTPFLVEDSDGALIGAGVISHHLFADCSGSPAFTVTLSFFR